MARRSSNIKLRPYNRSAKRPRRSPGGVLCAAVEPGVDSAAGKTGMEMNGDKPTARPKIKGSMRPAKAEQAGPAVLRREREYAAIKERVEAFLAYGAGAVAYVTGVPGSGKTHTVTKALQAIGAPYAYINCSKLNSKLGIFPAIGDSLPCCSRYNLQSLRAHFHSCGQHHIVVIDEVDFLRTRNELVLYNLFELPFIEHARVLLIVISNTLGSLSSKIESRIGKERIEFKPYSSADLQAILQDPSVMSSRPGEDGSPARTSQGLLRSKVRLSKSSPAEPGAALPNQKALELISKRVASSTGDIRKALDILSQAGDAGLQTVDAIIKDMTAPLLTKFVQAFCYYQKLVLFLNVDCSKDLLAWFNSFRAFCKLKSIPEIDFVSFRDVVDDLAGCGMFNVHGVRVSSPYHREEFEQAMRGDDAFKTFK